MDVSEHVGAKALRLVDQHRVILLDDHRALVAGDTGSYLVTASPLGLTCTCPARGVTCSHRVAAMIAFGGRV